MSLVKLYRVACDGDDCGKMTRGVVSERGMSAALARREARHAGWSHREKRDLCPSCSEKAYHRWTKRYDGGQS